MTKLLRAIRLTVPAALTLALAGCGAVGAIGLPTGRDRNPQPSPRDITMAAPTQPVESAALPPLGQPPPDYDPGPAADRPILADEPGAAPRGGVPAADTPAPADVAANAPAVGRTDLLGGWTVSASGETCQLFMTLTTWTGGYRASTRGCKTPALASISAWNLEGNQVVLNADGKSVARLYSAGNGRFSGQLDGGQSVTFYR